MPLLCFTFKNKIIKTIGIVLFITFFAIDLLIITLQHFPNLHFRDTFYLISFIFSGPKLFLIYAIIIIFILIVESYCETHSLPSNSDTCHNFMLQAQLFDDIADLIISPEMSGVEVIIVGDHPPPLFRADEIALFKTKQMSDASISWIHFKIKN